MFKTADTEQLKVPGHISHLGDLRDFVVEVGKKYHLPEKITKLFKLAVDEAATNIIQHAYKDLQSLITIRATIRKKSVTFVVIDQGSYFHPKWAGEPNIKDYIERGERAGLGIFMLRRLIDHIDYHKTEAGNELHLTKYLKSEDLRRVNEPLVSLPYALKARHFIVTVIIMLLAAIAVFAFFYVRAEEKLTDEFFTSGANISSQIAHQLENARPDLLTNSDGKFYIDAIILPAYEEHVGKIYSLSLEDTSGLIVWTTNHSERNNDFTRPVNAETIRDHVISYDIDGIVSVYEFEQSLTNSEETGFVKVHTLLLKDSLTNQIHNKRLSYLKVTLIALGIGYILLTLFNYLIMEPVRKLLLWVRAIRQGNPDEMDIDSSSEIGEIAQAFSDITRKFRDSQKNLKDHEKLAKEMALAKDIQSSLFPKSMPEIDSFEIAVCYEAAEKVGGDYYDFIQIDEDTLGIVIADVSGKGVPGSLVMTMIRTTLRTEARGMKDAAEVLARVNDFVIDDIKKGMFITVFYLILDTKNHRINFASAGHTPMVLFKSKRKSMFHLNPVGFPIGVQLPQKDLFFQNIHSETIQLEAGDTLVLYTDGVTEAVNPNGEFYGEERLLKTIGEYSSKSNRTLTEKLKNSIFSFREDGQTNDDITFITIRDMAGNGKIPEQFSVERKFLSMAELSNIFDIIRRYPDYDAHDIAQELNTKKYHYTEIEEERISTELTRRHLHTKALRIEYFNLAGTSGKRHKMETPLQTEESGSSKTRKKKKSSHSPTKSKLDEKKMLPDEDMLSPESAADFVFGDHIDEFVSNENFPESGKSAGNGMEDNTAFESEENRDVNSDDFDLGDISDTVVDSILASYGTAAPSDTKETERSSEESFDPEKGELRESEPGETEILEKTDGLTEKLTQQEIDVPEEKPDSTEQEEENVESIPEIDDTNESDAEEDLEDEEINSNSVAPFEGQKEDPVPEDSFAEFSDKADGAEIVEQDIFDGDDEKFTESNYREATPPETRDESESNEIISEETSFDNEAKEEGPILELVEPQDNSVHIQKLLLQGIQFYKNKEYDEALVLFKQVLILDPDYAECYSLLGNAYYRTNQFTAAIDTYLRASELNPTDVTVDENLAIIYTKLGRYHEAYSHLHTVFTTHPQRMDIENRMSRLSELLREKNQRVESQEIIPESDPANRGRQAFAEQIEQEKGDPFETGIDQYRNKDYGGAIRSFKQALEVSSNRKEAYLLLGNAYYRNKMFREAVETYEIITDREFHDSTTHENMGVIYAATGFYQEALREWQNLLKTDPEREDIREKIDKVSQLI